MAATVGNKFWEARYRHGREKIFKDSHTMLMAAYDYFEWNEANPYPIEEPIKSGELAGKTMTYYKPRPLTLEGLTQFWEVNRAYLDQFEKSLPEGEKDFSLVIAHIREVIYRQKFEGAVAGVMHHNIIAMELGMRQKVDNTHADPDGNALPPAVINVFTTPKPEDPQLEVKE